MRRLLIISRGNIFWKFGFQEGTSPVGTIKTVGSIKTRNMLISTDIMIQNKILPIFNSTFVKLNLSYSFLYSLRIKDFCSFFFLYPFYYQSSTSVDVLNFFPNISFSFTLHLFIFSLITFSFFTFHFFPFIAFLCICFSHSYYFISFFFPSYFSCFLSQYFCIRIQTL